MKADFKESVVQMIVRSNLIKALWTSALVILFSAAVSSAQSIHRDELSTITIDNFGCLKDSYCRGSQPNRNEYAELSRLGVKTVIDLQKDGKREEGDLVEAQGMKFFRIGLTTSSAPDEQSVSEFLKIVNDPANQPVYVHCKGGKHRTGTLTAIYRIADDGWTADQAYQEMKQFRFETGLVNHNALKNFVFGYYASHPGAVAGNTASPAVSKTGSGASATGRP